MKASLALAQHNSQFSKLGVLSCPPYTHLLQQPPCCSTNLNLTVALSKLSSHQSQLSLTLSNSL